MDVDCICSFMPLDAFCQFVEDETSCGISLENGAPVSRCRLKVLENLASKKMFNLAAPIGTGRNSALFCFLVTPSNRELHRCLALFDAVLSTCKETDLPHALGQLTPLVEQPVRRDLLARVIRAWTQSVLAEQSIEAKMFVNLLGMKETCGATQLQPFVQKLLSAARSVGYGLPNVLFCFDIGIDIAPSDGNWTLMPVDMPELAADSGRELQIAKYHNGGLTFFKGVTWKLPPQKQVNPFGAAATTASISRDFEYQMLYSGIEKLMRHQAKVAMKENVLARVFPNEIAFHAFDANGGRGAIQVFATKSQMLAALDGQYRQLQTRLASLIGKSPCIRIERGIVFERLEQLVEKICTMVEQMQRFSRSLVAVRTNDWLNFTSCPCSYLYDRIRFTLDQCEFNAGVCRMQPNVHLAVCTLYDLLRSVPLGSRKHAVSPLLSGKSMIRVRPLRGASADAWSWPFDVNVAPSAAVASTTCAICLPRGLVLEPVAMYMKDNVLCPQDMRRLYSGLALKSGVTKMAMPSFIQAISFAQVVSEARTLDAVVGELNNVYMEAVMHKLIRFVQKRYGETLQYDRADFRLSKQLVQQLATLTGKPHALNNPAGANWKNGQKFVGLVAVQSPACALEVARMVFNRMDKLRFLQ